MLSKNFCLSPRLKAVLECVGEYGVLADIGTDHAYLPIEACRREFCERAIACDIGRGPLGIAERNIIAAGLTGRIEARLGDGLAPLFEGEADCIVIAGMGGMRICEIISAAPNKIKNARLILQPQHDLEELRRFLHANMYNIVEERLVRERSRFYVISVAQRADTVIPWTAAEYFLGKVQGDGLLLYYSDMHKKISAYIGSVTDENTRELNNKRLEWLDDYCGMGN